MVKKIILMTGVLLCTLGLTLGFAQTETEEEAEEMTGFAYGQVVSVSASKIVVLEYDYDTDQSVESAFIINSETKYEDVDSYSEIASEDEVEIRYKEVGGQKIAKVITKETTWQLPEDYDYNDEDQKGEEDTEEEYIEESEDATRG